MFNIQYLDQEINKINSQIFKTQWLREHDVNANRVAHFGCGDGYQTIALMGVTRASEVIGLDINENRILQAQQNFEQIQEDIRENFRWVNDQEFDLRWWNDIPDFIKLRIIHNNIFVRYVAQDITERVNLKDNYFDLVFCDYVLHHIWYDHKRGNGLIETQFAVSEMARVASIGGLIAARELITYQDNPRLDFNPLFEDAGLELVFSEEKPRSNLRNSDYEGFYLYSKL